MRLNVTLVLSDDERRRVRAALGRGGVATRADCRIWLQRLVADTLQAGPAPKVRRKAAPKPEPAKPEPARDQLPLTDDSVCLNCGRTYDRHGKMSQTCLPATGVPLGARFRDRGF